MISEQVVKEVTRYFDKYHGGKLAQLFRRYLLESCIIISKENIVDAMVEYRTQIKEKDLEQLAATKALGLKYLLSFDRDFEPFEEYTTPHEFIRLLKLKTAPTEF